MNRFDKHVKTLRDIQVIESLQEIKDPEKLLKLEEMIAHQLPLPDGITFEIKEENTWENGDYVTKKVPVFYSGLGLSDADYDAMMQVESLKRLDRIEKHLYFFKILAIVLLTLYALSVIWTLTFN